MPRRTLRELAAENAVLFGKLEEVRDDLDDFLSDDAETDEANTASGGDADDGDVEDDEEDEGAVASESGEES